VRSSGGKYGFSTGHALLIGAITKKVLDSTVLNKKCGVCVKHLRHTGSMDNVKNHCCVKNYEGTSKSMRATALVKMLIRMLEEKGVSIFTIISDNDSYGRVKPQHVKNGGLLPLNVEEPNPIKNGCLQGPSTILLCNAPVKTSNITKGWQHT
jgi:hypothetical protein